MSYLFFSFDVVLQATFFASLGCFIGIIMQKSDSHRCYFVSKAIVMSSLSCASFLVFVVLIAAVMNPSLMHPLRTPLDLIQVAESANPIARWSTVFALLLVSLASGLFQLNRFLSARDHERKTMKTKLEALRKDLSDANAYATKKNAQVKKLQKKLLPLEEGYAFIMASEDVPQHVKEKYFALCKNNK